MNQGVDTKEYEISFLATNQEGGSAVASVLQQYGATVTEKGQLSDVRLSYPIKKHTQALFGCMVFRATADSISKIQQSLKLQPEIIRVLIVTPPVIHEQENREKRYDGKASREKRDKVDVAESAPHAQSNVLSNEALKEQLAVLEGESKK